MSEISSFLASESNVENRTKKAKKLAERIFYNNTETEIESIYGLRFKLLQYRPALKGLFDSYFDNRTLDDLILEIELERLMRLGDNDTRMEEIVRDKANQEELKGMFDDWIEEDNKPKKRQTEWVDVQDKVSPEDVQKMAEQFMQTGDFITEENKEKSDANKQ